MVGKEVAFIRNPSVPAPRGRDPTEAPAGTHHRRALYFLRTSDAGSGVSINDFARPAILALARLRYAPFIQTTEDKPE
jgi:hypothetical protein